MSNLKVRTFLAWKNGDDAEDCQDSIFPTEVVDLRGCSFAVADGATTSFMSQSWARILTRRFGENPERAYQDWLGWLENAQSEWRQEVENKAQAENASFLVLNGLYAKRPAAATFAGLTIAQPTPGKWAWRAIVLGDSCLFRLTENGSLHGWNIRSSGEFSNLVETAESWPKPNQYSPTVVGSEPHGVEPSIGPRESLLLVTDALAKWLLRRHESDHPVWGTIISLKSDSDFQTFVAQARTDPTSPLENDDVALVVLAFGDAPASILSQRYTPVFPIEMSPASQKAQITSVHNTQDSPFFTLPEFPRTPVTISQRLVLLTRQKSVLYLLLALSFAMLVLALRSSHKWHLKSQRLSRDNALLRRQLENETAPTRSHIPEITPTIPNAGNTPGFRPHDQLQNDDRKSIVLPSPLNPDAQGVHDGPAPPTEDDHARDAELFQRNLQNVNIRLTRPLPIEPTPWPEPRPQ